MKMNLEPASKPDFYYKVFEYLRHCVLSLKPALVFLASHLALTLLAQDARPIAFVSTVEFSIDENHPKLLERSRRMIIHELDGTLGAWPTARVPKRTLEAQGNQVIVSFVTLEDHRAQIHRDIDLITENLSGTVEMRGRARVFRTGNQPIEGGYLEVSVDPKKLKVQSIRAQSVPFRDLLREIKWQLRNSPSTNHINYLLSEECAARRIDYHYGSVTGADVEVILGQLADAFGLIHSKKNGTHILRGPCARLTVPEPALRIPVIPAYHLVPSTAPVIEEAQENIPFVRIVDYP